MLKITQNHLNICNCQTINDTIISKFVKGFQEKHFMKYIFFLAVTAVCALGCTKGTAPEQGTTTKISQDSLIRTIHQKWKFSISISNPAVSTKLNNWEEWRNYANEITISPSPSLSGFTFKSAAFVQKVSALRISIPEAYNKQETKARLALLETNVQNLDMLLELEPLNPKEITKLLAAIQKNTNSLINQFDEFEVKSKIPKEEGEDQLLQPVDTIKRATLNAIPKE